MFLDSPAADIAKGAMKGALEWSEEKISKFIQKLTERKLAFIEEPDTIKIVREQYEAGETKFYQIYIRDKELLLLVKLGLTLRKLDEDQKQERLHNLRDKIFRKYKAEGLHIAEFVQTGILSKYVGILIDKLVSVKDLEKEMTSVLKNIEKHIILIQAQSKKQEIIKKVSIIINAHSPAIFIISGVRSAAKIAQDCMEQLKEIMKDYEFERYSSGEKETFFFKKRITEKK